MIEDPLAHLFRDLPPGFVATSDDRRPGRATSFEAVDGTLKDIRPIKSNGPGPLIFPLVVRDAEAKDATGFGRFLNAYCEYAGVDIDELAKWTGMSPAGVKMIIEGVANPKLGTVARIISALEREIEDGPRLGLIPLGTVVEDMRELKLRRGRNRGGYDKTLFGAWLEEYQEERGVDMRAVAKSLGIRSFELRAVVRGTAEPSLTLAARLVEAVTEQAGVWDGEVLGIVLHNPYADSDTPEEGISWSLDEEQSQAS